jgi:Holliday junction resolvase
VSGARHRRKGNRVEIELVHRHRELGIKAERYPLSGASRFRGSGHDIDLYLHGDDAAPAVFECKARKNGSGFVTLEKWLGEYDGCFLRRDHADPLVLLSWSAWTRVLERLRRYCCTAPRSFRMVARCHERFASLRFAAPRGLKWGH